MWKSGCINQHQFFYSVTKLNNDVKISVLSSLSLHGQEKIVNKAYKNCKMCMVST